MTKPTIPGPAVDVPKARNGEAHPSIYSANSAVVSIPKDGEFFLGDAAIQLADLPPRVGALLGNKRPFDQIVYLRCARPVKYGTVAEVIDKVRAAGIHYIGLVADHDVRMSPTIFEAAILNQLTEAEIKAPISPPPPRTELLNVSQATPADSNLPPPPPPPASSPKPYTIVELAPNRFEVVERLVVEMNKNGSGPEQAISLNGETLQLSELENKLREVFASRSSSRTPVYFRAPKEKSYEDVIYAMDRIAGARPGEIVLHIDDLDNIGTNILRPRSTEETPGIMRLEKGVTMTGVPGGMPGGVPGGIETNAPTVAAPPSPAKVIRMSGGVMTGRAIRRVEPEYPAIARSAHASGTVMIEVEVDESGNVTSARAVSGHPLLQNAAVQAARQWKFTPMMLSGKPVKVVGTIIFNFKE
jgi:TonB family protein